MNKPNLGAHVSTAGGLYKSIENATQIGAETIQIFGASPRAWNTRVPMKDEVEKFKTVAKESAVKNASAVLSPIQARKVMVPSPNSVVLNKG